MSSFPLATRAMVSSTVARGLEDAGLKRFVPAFSGVSDQAFLGLMMSDYASYGVVELEDKQRLFRLIKSIAASAKSSDVPAPALEKPNALIDLDENDGDLLADVSGVHLRHWLLSAIAFPRSRSNPTFAAI